MRANRWTRNSRIGALPLSLLLLLSGCASAPSLLPQQRLVVACPAHLVWAPSRQLPILPDPLTNRGLIEFAESLLDQLLAEWTEADRVAGDCRAWLKEQGAKR